MKEKGKNKKAKKEQKSNKIGTEREKIKNQKKIKFDSLEQHLEGFLLYE